MTRVKAFYSGVNCTAPMTIMRLSSTLLEGIAGSLILSTYGFVSEGSWQIRDRSRSTIPSVRLAGPSVQCSAQDGLDQLSIFRPGIT